MAGKISVIGNVPVSGTLPEGARGADVLVAARGKDVLPAMRLAPAAVLLLVDADRDEVGRVLDATLQPRQRVLGIAAGDVERAVRALIEGSPTELRVTLRDGERDVVLSRGGIALAR